MLSGLVQLFFHGAKSFSISWLITIPVILELKESKVCPLFVFHTCCHSDGTVMLKTDGGGYVSLTTSGFTWVHDRSLEFQHRHLRRNWRCPSARGKWHNLYFRVPFPSIRHQVQKAKSSVYLYFQTSASLSPQFFLSFSYFIGLFEEEQDTNKFNMTMLICI